MSSTLKPIKLYGVGGPNPPKVAMVLEELQLPYEPIMVPFTDVKKPEYTAINPNGRLPSIYDPNTDLTIWESGAIVLYLTDRYDAEHKMSYPRGSNESYLAQQWLIFQVSGQGPYYGQSVYFQRYHSEQVPSVVERFNREVVRVTGVLEEYLSKQKKGPDGDGPWLVGGKFSYADLAWINWQVGVGRFVPQDVFDPESCPNVQRWLKNMTDRGPIKKVLEDNERGTKAAMVSGKR